MLGIAKDLDIMNELLQKAEALGTGLEEEDRNRFQGYVDNDMLRLIAIHPRNFGVDTLLDKPLTSQRLE
jgi:hypothetical protein